MTDSATMMRVFFAIDLPQSTKNAVESIILDLKKYYPPKAVRWSKTDKLHVTLQFLKEIKSVDRDNVVKQVQIAIQKIDPFTLSLGPVQLFPIPNRPKMIALHVNPTPELDALVLAVGQGITTAGYPIEEHTFRGHVTLGRLNFGVLKRPVSLPKLDIALIKPDIIDEIVLTHSEPTPQGSRYTQLAHFTLK